MCRRTGATAPGAAASAGGVIDTSAAIGRGLRIAIDSAAGGVRIGTGGGDAERSDVRYVRYDRSAASSAVSSISLPSVALRRRGRIS